jgi:hypothetical protein
MAQIASAQRGARRAQLGLALRLESAVAAARAGSHDARALTVDFSCAQ